MRGTMCRLGTETATRLLAVIIGLTCGACSDAPLIVGRIADRPPDVAINEGGTADGGAGRGMDASASSDADGRSVVDAGKSTRTVRIGVESGTHNQFCARRGLALEQRVSPSAADSYPVRLERKLFSYALCACNELGFRGDSFLVDGFDSTQDVYQPGQTGAAVGVNGVLTGIATETQLSGHLFVAGSESVAITGANMEEQPRSRNNPRASTSAISASIRAASCRSPFTE